MHMTNDTASESGNADEKPAYIPAGKPNSMMPSFQGLKDKLSSGSFTFRLPSQTVVTSLSPADQALKDQLRAVVKAFKNIAP